MSSQGEMAPPKPKLGTFLLTHPLLSPAPSPRMGWVREGKFCMCSDTMAWPGLLSNWDCMIRTHRDPMFILPLNLLKSHWAGGCTGVIYHLPGASTALDSQQRILLLEHEPKT